ncbi:MAG: DUF4433 domain-containing protein, partial [Candidatus Lindowbacteria bacterium]|nr:DUF4433 domain-containing protein [Candidatus Lindowbacteria bacterium]
MRNAAANRGRGIGEGEHVFETMFAASVMGANNKLYKRMESHPHWLPTDEQAEVLIQDRIAQEDILGIVVGTESQAKCEHARLIQLRVEPLSIIIAPDFFDPYRLSSKIRLGLKPSEMSFNPEVA